MKLSHVLKAVFVVICCVIIFAFGLVIIPFGFSILCIWIIALMFSEEENESK